MSPTRFAFLKAIQADPGNDIPRLVFADYLEELDRPRLAELTETRRRLAEIQATDPCPFCNAVSTGYPHGRGCYYHDLRRAEWAMLSDPVCVDEARDGATLEFLRVSCGRTTKSGKPAKAVPKDVGDWLRKNWRRLLPRLTEDWDHPGCWEIGPPEGLPPLGPLIDNPDNRYTRWERWETRTGLDCGIPYVPDRERYHDVYTPRLGLSFDRGFLSSANWRAPRLGERLARDIAADQPLAIQSGPGAVTDTPFSQTSVIDCAIDGDRLTDGGG